MRGPTEAGDRSGFVSGRQRCGQLRLEVVPRLNGVDLRDFDERGDYDPGLAAPSKPAKRAFLRLRAVGRMVGDAGRGRST